VKIGAVSAQNGRAPAELLREMSEADSYLLSERGALVGTDWFVKVVKNCLAGRPTLFVVGEASGFPSELPDHAKRSISLTPLMLPHELAIVLLVEQVWRAVSIEFRHPYHKA